MTVQTQGYITLIIGEVGDRRTFRLDGTVGTQIKVGFRAKDGDSEVALGTFESMIGSVAKALGLGGSTFEADFKKRLDELAGVGPLTDIVAKLRSAALFVTDLAISAECVTDANGKETYEVSEAAFGFRVEFTGLTLGPIELSGFGVLFEYTKTPVVTGGKLSTRSIPA